MSQARAIVIWNVTQMSVVIKFKDKFIANKYIDEFIELD